MAKELEILKKEEFIGDGIKDIMDEYLKVCREDKDSPSVKGFLVYLNNNSLLNEGEILNRILDKRVKVGGGNRKPNEIIKEMSMRFGIKKRSLWNYWDKYKKRKVYEP